MAAPLRVVFMGTAELACASLESLARSGQFEVAGVVTQPDKPQGRSLQLQPPPVKVAALTLGLPIFQPIKLRQEPAVQTVAQWRPDLIIVAAYGQILPKSVLTLPRHGCVNVHASLLPKYRGAAPIQWSILNDDPETGVTIMMMDEGLDTGAILTQRRTRIEPADNAQTLHDRLARLGAELLLETLPGYVSGTIQPVAQPAAGALYARKITKDDGRLDWKLPARTLWNRVRAFTPWPSAYTKVAAQPQPYSLKIWAADLVAGQGSPGEILSLDAEGLVVACGEQALKITAVQKEGKRRMSVREFLAGNALRPGLSFE
jgi:methionyl-tRNA formyltransferase